MSVRVCVCQCERENARDREIKRQRERGREREREKERDRERVCVFVCERESVCKNILECLLCIIEVTVFVEVIVYGTTRLCACLFACVRERARDRKHQRVCAHFCVCWYVGVFVFVCVCVSACLCLCVCVCVCV